MTHLIGPRLLPLVGAILLAAHPGPVFAQSSDLSGVIPGADALGDGWRIDSQQDDSTMFVTGSGPHAVAGYLVTYSQNPQVRASIALYEFADHASAVASLSEVGAYWGRGNTTLIPLDGLGDDRSFRAYGVGIGPGSGITFVDGPVVAYVRAEDASATDTSGVNALCDSLAAAQDGLLQASGN